MYTVCVLNNNPTFQLIFCMMYTLADTNADPRQCTPGGSVCHADATCTQVTPYVCDCNPASSYRCECNQGYTGDGLTCTGKSEQNSVDLTSNCIMCIAYVKMVGFQTVHYFPGSPIY